MVCKEKTLESEYIYKGKILSLRKDLVSVKDGNTSYREIVEHGGAVGIVCIDDEGKVILVKQYRKAVEKVLMEIPAGKIEGREQPYYCAIRELEEETGVISDEMIFLGEFYLSAGFSSEKMYLYFCKVKKQGLQKLDGDEDLEILRLDYEKALEMVYNDEISDAKTAIGIMLSKKYI
ncbi:NUDIX hydrolase [Clostridium cylindrosporum]|uniref:ADP-ribose pyrophosphatase NudF n=1 Tax=Clostridium cylindrosporum DSM 605 TaxID=1121307 RepID=A0A0J8G0N7_CLOCY|nr:NUDIX hydrolase [Clostridium cylindrosporum]KMT21361.1 ADP-ribose pyrophosphatase NudF [Clostridium cylindrosporum DSM 605]